MKDVKECLCGQSGVARVVSLSRLSELGVSRRFWVALCVGILAIIMVGSVEAVPVTYLFGGITQNNDGPNDTLWGEQQLSVDVFNGAGMVKFQFKNVGLEDLIIAEIYFDNGPLLGISNIMDNPVGSKNIRLRQIMITS